MAKQRKHITNKEMAAGAAQEGRAGREPARHRLRAAQDREPGSPMEQEPPTPTQET